MCSGKDDESVVESPSRTSNSDAELKLQPVAIPLCSLELFSLLALVFFFTFTC